MIVTFARGAISVAGGGHRCREAVDAVIDVQTKVEQSAGEDGVLMDPAAGVGRVGPRKAGAEYAEQWSHYL